MKQIALLLSIVILGISSRAQGIYNNGARIVSESGTSLRCASVRVFTNRNIIIFSFRPGSWHTKQFHFELHTIEIT